MYTVSRSHQISKHFGPVPKEIKAILRGIQSFPLLQFHF